jgi:hypothetical protein
MDRGGSGVGGTVRGFLRTSFCNGTSAARFLGRPANWRKFGKALCRSSWAARFKALCRFDGL